MAVTFDKTWNSLKRCVTLRSSCANRLQTFLAYMQGLKPLSKDLTCRAAGLAGHILRN